MYLQLFEYFVNNRDVQPNVTLPLNPDVLSAVYDLSTRFIDNKKIALCSRKKAGVTLGSIDQYLKLVRLFVNNSETIYKILNLSDFKTFHHSLLELEEVLLVMLNVSSSVKAKNVNGESIKEEENNLEDNKTLDDIKSDVISKIERESKTDEEPKEDDGEENCHEEKDKHEDSDFLENKNDTECITWVFNEDITCPHG